MLRKLINEHAQKCADWFMRTYREKLKRGPVYIHVDPADEPKWIALAAEVLVKRKGWQVQVTTGEDFRVYKLSRVQG